MLEFELVLPAYNEARSLPMLLERAVSAVTNAKYSADTCQLVIVQNGSKDDTADVLENLKKGPLGKWFRIVTVPVNQGYGYGLLSGLMTTTASNIGYSHADLQCDPQDVFRALQILRSHPSSAVLVKGTRSGRDWKDWTVSRVFEILARIIVGLKVKEVNAQPKVFPRSLLAHLSNAPKDFAFDLYVLYQAQKQGFAIATIPVHFPPRVHGVSNWANSFFSRYKTILKMIGTMWRVSLSEGRL